MSYNNARDSQRIREIRESLQSASNKAEKLEQNRRGQDISMMSTQSRQMQRETEIDSQVDAIMGMMEQTRKALKTRDNSMRFTSEEDISVIEKQKRDIFRAEQLLAELEGENSLLQAQNQKFMAEMNDIDRVLSGDSPLNANGFGARVLAFLERVATNQRDKDAAEFNNALKRQEEEYQREIAELKSNLNSLLRANDELDNLRRTRETTISQQDGNIKALQNQLGDLALINNVSSDLRSTLIALVERTMEECGTKDRRILELQNDLQRVENERRSREGALFDFKDAESQIVLDRAHLNDNYFNGASSQSSRNFASTTEDRELQNLFRDAKNMMGNLDEKAKVGFAWLDTKEDLDALYDAQMTVTGAEMILRDKHIDVLNQKTGECEKTLQDILALLKRPVPVSPPRSAVIDRSPSFPIPEGKSRTEFIKDWFANLRDKPAVHDRGVSTSPIVLPPPSPSPQVPPTPSSVIVQTTTTTTTTNVPDKKPEYDHVRKFHLRDKTKDPTGALAAIPQPPPTPNVVPVGITSLPHTAPQQAAAVVRSTQISGNIGTGSNLNSVVSSMIAPQPTLNVAPSISFVAPPSQQQQQQQYQQQRTTYITTSTATNSPPKAIPFQSQYPPQYINPSRNQAGNNTVVRY